MCKVTLTLSITQEVAAELIDYVREHHANRSLLVGAWIHERIVQERGKAAVAEMVEKQSEVAQA